MMLVPTCSPHLPFTTRKLCQLDEEMNFILNATHLDERTKYQQYQQVLRKYLHYAQDPSPPIAPSASKARTTTMIDLTGKKPPTKRKRYFLDPDVILPPDIPGIYRKDIASLLADGILEYNDRGEFIYEGQPIHGSQVGKLVLALITRSKTFKKRARKLPGWVELRTMMKS